MSELMERLLRGVFVLGIVALALVSGTLLCIATGGFVLGPSYDSTATLAVVGLIAWLMLGGACYVIGGLWR